MIFKQDNAKLRNIVVLIAIFTTLVLSTLSNTVIQKMGFLIEPKSSDWMNEFVINKYMEGADLETTQSLTSDLQSKLESKFIIPLSNNGPEGI